MRTTSYDRGYVLVSLLGPLLGVVAVGLGAVWLIRTNWASFPPLVQSGLKVVGIGVAVGSFAFSVWRESRGRDEHPGF